MTLGEGLKRFRVEKKLTQKQIATDLGTFQQVYSTYESDKVVPAVSVLIKLAEKYHVSLDYLTGLSNKYTLESEQAEGEFVQAVIKSTKILQSALEKRGVENVRVLDNRQGDG